MVKKLPANAGDVRDAGSVPGGGRSLEEGMATHSGVLAWRNPMEGRSLEEGMATHSGVLAWRNPMDRGAWQVTVYGVAKSQTGLSD